MLDNIDGKIGPGTGILFKEKSVEENEVLRKQRIDKEKERSNIYLLGKES